MKNAPMPIVVLISGRGSIMSAIASAADQLNCDLTAVLSNNPDAAGLELARAAGIQTEAIDHRQYSSREAFEAQLAKKIDAYSPQLIVLAGFMRILSPGFVNRYLGRLINIHPSLLPKYPGLNTHERALNAGDDKHGASIHFVTPELDGGPVIAQTRIDVPADISAEGLAALLLPREHALMLATLELFTRNSVTLRDNQVIINNRVLENVVEF